MHTVFIAGSMNIKHLDPQVKERIANILSSNLSVVVGDADGADKSIQSYLLERDANNTTVYCSGPQPRNNLGNWPVRSVASKHEPGSRAFFTAKDIEMANAADYGLMIWDSKSTGTLSNVIDLLNRKKKSVVFVNKKKQFITISDVSHLETLLMCMSDGARQMANDKIRLNKRIEALKFEQSQMF